MKKGSLDQHIGSGVHTVDGFSEEAWNTKKAVLWYQGNLQRFLNVTLDHKTSLKCQFFEIKIYT